MNTINISKSLVIAAIVSMAMAAQSQAEPVPLLTPGDQIIGGLLLDPDFIEGLVGTTGGVNNWPAAEPPEDLIDGFYGGGGAKYLNFAELNTGVIITPSGATGGLPSTVTSMTLWVANDAVDRDPTSFELYGTNLPVVPGGPGSTYLLSDFTLVDSGDLLLPDPRNDPSVAVTGPPFMGFHQTVAISASSAYTSYMLIFPTVKNEAGANSMQISEVQFEGELIPEPTSFLLAALGLLGLLGFARRRK